MYTNLRPSTDTPVKAYSPVMPLRPVVADGIWFPLCTTAGHLILRRGNSVYSMPVAIAGSSPALVRTFDETPSAAVALSGNTILVSLETESVILDVKTGQTTSRRENVPAAMLTRGDIHTASVSFPAFTLSREYSVTDRELDKSDLSLLASAMKTAFNAFESTVRAGNRFINPVLARYRLLDSDGGTIYLSAPLLFGSAAKITSPYASYISFPVSGRNVSALRHTADAYRLRFHIPAVAAPHIAQARIEVTDEIGVFSPDATPYGYITRSSQNGTLSISALYGGALNSAANITDLIPDILASASWYVAATVANPFSGTARTVTVSAPSRKRAVTENSSTSAVASSTFTATSFCRAGNLILAANPSFYRFKGHAPLSFSASVYDMPDVTCLCKVTFRDGSETSFSAPNGPWFPTAINPLVTYPSADAVSVFLAFRHPQSTECIGRTFGLTPVSGADMAYFLASDVTDIPVNTAVLPPQIDTDAAPLKQPDGGAGHIMTLAAGSPLSPADMEQVSQGTISTMAPATGSSSGWDYVRARFYLFSGEGIFCAALSRDAAIRAVAPISARQVTSAAAVAVTPEAVFAVSSDGTLLKITGVKAAPVLTRYSGTLLYDAIHRELVIRPSASLTSGNYPVWDIIASELRFRSLPGVPVNTMNTPQGSYTGFSSTQGLYRLGVENNGSSAVISAETLILPAKLSRMKTLTVNATSENPVSLLLSVTADHGAGTQNSLPVFVRLLEGQINSPLTFRFPCPASPALHLTLSGTVSSDFRLIP